MAAAYKEINNLKVGDNTLSVVHLGFSLDYVDDLSYDEKVKILKIAMEKTKVRTLLTLLLPNAQWLILSIIFIILKE